MCLPPASSGSSGQFARAGSWRRSCKNRRVLWLDLDILCPGRQLGRGRFAREQAALEYLLNVGGADWAYLVTIAAIPALLFALWGAKRAHRRLHAVAQERLLEQDGPLQQAT